ncbi:MAG: Eco57I restriction-modification methylase domain-containing protein [Spirochaetota bacterium]|nr:Eco57I restriction-modification methylase domain-containing protein [Spirochaetota bacterium]
MTLTIQTIDKILKSKKLSDYHIDTINITNFQKGLVLYIEVIKKIQYTATEETQKQKLKNLFSSIDNYQYEMDHDSIDLSIWYQNKLKVIIETKTKKNAEMITDDELNKKAFQEALYYYMEQSKKEQNEITYIMITNFQYLYLFEEKEFLNLTKKSSIKNAFTQYYKNKDGFYKKISELNIETTITITKIDLFNDDSTLIYRIFDKPLLLNQALENDANELNREFYQELLHIMGLQEKDNKLVKSTIQNTLLDLTESKIGNKEKNEELFETALGLNILWLNRILFLKILESQLKVFRNDPDFHILDSKHITGYHLLSKLFFSILSTPRAERHSDDKKYDTIPYLNSSLFEETEIERQYRISDLDIERPLKIKSDSVLYKDKDFTKKELNLLEYLLRFLNCFSYNSDSDSVDKNTLIKSSVLGTVFERLNGYKDGSHFTPASITMYMSEKVLQKRIIDIFNKEFALEFEDFKELISYAKKNFYKKEDIEKAQALVDNMTIIDPAVGSGHFLVSSLNELIKIKSQLGLLHKDIKVSIENDELIIKSSFGDNFVYERREGKISEERQEIQKAIFETKKHIIENQLYGVDINPNSVNICRLRLWIELLKHTYYTDSDYINLEVLPNLEFKVMTANSLISVKDIPLYFNKTHRAELSRAMHTYYNAVLTEKEQVKTEVKALISNVKSHIEQLKNYDPFNTIVSCSFFDSGLMFGIESFDIVIGNPPYVSNKGISSTMMSQYKEEYGIQDDLYNYFYLRGFEFLKDGGILGYITSNTFLTLQSKQKLRQYLQSKKLVEMRLVDNVFEHAAVEPIIVIAYKSSTTSDNYQFNYVDNRNQAILYEGNNILIDINTYREAPNQVFFTPNVYNLAIANKYFDTIHSLMTSYWDIIKTSANIDKNKNLLNSYKATLKAGDIALLGLLTDGGQGLATANNGFYIGVRASNKDAERTYRQRIEKIAKFNKEFATTHDITKMTELEIRALFLALKTEHGRDIFGQGFLYQIISDDEIADVNTLTQDEKDNGIKGERSFVPYDKGDKDGNRWYMPTSYCINWSVENVKFLKTDPKARWQGYTFFFKEGFSWSDVLLTKSTVIKDKSTFIKARIKESTINDVKSMSLYPLYPIITSKYLLVMINSYFMFHYMKQIVNNTISIQINDMRQVPIIIPTEEQLQIAEELFDRAKAIKDQQIQKLITKDIADEQLDALQNEVDDFVYALYGLSAEEITIVEGGK